MEAASAAMWLREPAKVALAGAENLEQFAPLMYDHPPEWLAHAIERARQHGRDGNLEAAEAVLRETLTADSSSSQRAELGRYREKVTWVRDQNVRRLAALAWTWVTLCREPRTVELDQQLERIERYAALHYNVTELRVERGWAETKVRQTLIPAAWLEA